MKHKLHSWLDAFRWRKLLLIWAVFLAMAAILFAERSGIRYASTQFKIDYLPRTEVKPASIAMFGQPVTCLLLYDSGQEGTDRVKEQFDQILLDMKVGTQAVDVHTTALTSLPEFSQYQTVVVLMSNLDALGKRLIDLMNWVQNGGSVLFAMTPDKTTYFDAISQKLGVQSSAWEYKMVESIVPSEDFMLGGGQRYEFSDPFQSALSVSLREDTTVYARTGDKGVPLVWEHSSGSGRVVVDNIGIYDKVLRGVYAASYSLLCDATAYPVINGAVFYLDDFPSPVPGGDGTYIRRDYSMSIADFYSKVWWPDLMKLAQKYSIRFTGVMIENYEDDTVDAPIRQPDTQQFRYFGSLLLRQGGEVGYGLMMVWDVVLLYRYFPQSDESPWTFLKWVDEFLPLAFTGLCTNIGLFAHLVICWVGPVGVQVKGLFYGAPYYDVPALIAFLTILITSINFVVSVEVNFYPKYRDYYSLFNDGGVVGDIVTAEEEMLAVLNRELRFTALKQLFVTAAVLSLEGTLLDLLPLGFNDLMHGYFRTLCVGYGLYAVGNTILMILLYFTDYRGAVTAAAVFAVSASGFTALSMAFNTAFYGFGFLIGAALFYLVTLLRLDAFTANLPYRVLGQQPIVAETKAGRFTRLGLFLETRSAVRAKHAAGEEREDE